MNGYRYTVVLLKENGIYRAFCPAFPGCRAYGDSKQEAVRNIEISVTHRLEVLKDKGMPAPEDQDRM